MQEELLLDNATAGRVNEIMGQRIDFCKDRCSSSSFEGICILKKDAKPTKKESTKSNGPLPTSKAGIAKTIVAEDFNGCTEFCSSNFDSNKKSRLMCFDICEEKFGHSK